MDSVLSKASAALQDINVLSHVDSISSVLNSIRRIEEQEQEQILATEEQLKDLQLQLNALKSEHKLLKDEHEQIVSDTKRKHQETEDLQHLNAALEADMETMQSRNKEMKTELADMQSSQSMDTTNPITLQIFLYRGLGLQFLQEEGKMQLASHDSRKIQTVYLNDYSPYFKSKYVWDFISDSL